MNRSLFLIRWASWHPSLVFLFLLHFTSLFVFWNALKASNNTAYKQKWHAKKSERKTMSEISSIINKSYSNTLNQNSTKTRSTLLLEGQKPRINLFIQFDKKKNRQFTNLLPNHNSDTSPGSTKFTQLFLFYV